MHAARHREGGNLWFRENPDAMAADFRPLSTIYEGKIAGAYFSVLLVKEPNGETYSVSLISMPERFDLSSVRETPTASTNVRNPMLFWILAR